MGRGPGPEQRVKRTTTVKPESGNAKEEEVKRLRAGRRRHGAGRRGASRGPRDGAAPGGPPAGARRRRRRRPGPKIPARYGIPTSSESTGGGGLPHEPRFLLPVHRQAYTRLHVFLSVYSAHLPPFFGVAKHRLPFFCQMQFPAEEKKQRRRWERERGNAEQGRQGRSVRVHLPKCHYQYYTSNQGENKLSCATAAHGRGALLRATSARTCGWGGRTGTGGPGGTGAAAGCCTCPRRPACPACRASRASQGRRRTRRKRRRSARPSWPCEDLPTRTRGPCCTAAAASRSGKRL